MLRDKKQFREYFLINVNSNRLFQVYYHSELGFLLATLLFDMLIDPFLHLMELAHENEDADNVIKHKKAFSIVLIVISLACALLLVFSYYAMRKPNKLFIKLCLLAQVVFIISVIVRSIGLLLDYFPFYWNSKWITSMHFCLNLIIPLFSIFLNVCVHLNEINFISSKNLALEMTI